jgi:exopolyphosphatase/guanosine-5'-triphosphate,3'-diphosphate pyrophosphatase
MRVAAIDIGTNTVLLLVAETDAHGQLHAVQEHATITRLGEGVDRTRVLAKAAIERTVACLDAYAALPCMQQVDRIAIVGTSAMRDAGGGDVLRAHVKARFGIEARTISGDEEARLTFAGATSGLVRDREARTVVFDIGGGSTEVVDGTASTGEIRYAHSYDVGSVRLTERYVRHDPPNDDERAALWNAARTAFASLPDSLRDDAPVGIAGTVTTLAAISLGMSTYDSTRVHGAVLRTVDIARTVSHLATLPVSERAAIPGLQPQRADVIVAGGIVALAFLERIGAHTLVVSDRGVRWGLAEELARGPSA